MGTKVAKGAFVQRNAIPMKEKRQKLNAEGKLTRMTHVYERALRREEQKT